MLAGHSLLNSGRTETKEGLLLTEIIVARLPSFSCIGSLSSISTGQVVLAYTLVVFNERNPGLGDPESFIMDCKQTWPKFTQRRDIISIILDSKKNLPFSLEGNTISIIHGCLLYRHSWKDSLSKTAVSTSAHETCRNLRPKETCVISLTTGYCNCLFICIFSKCAVSFLRTGDSLFPVLYL